MNKLCTYISLVLFSFFSLSMNSCMSYKSVQIKEINSVEPLNNDISTGKLVLNLRVANPNSYSIKVKKYDLHAYVNNVDLGQVEAGKKIVLKKKSDENYQITFSPDMTKILNLLPSLLFTGRGEVALKGEVKINAGLLTKKYSIDLKKKVSASDFR